MSENLIERFRAAGEAFVPHLAAIDDRWSEPTPCSDWDVRALTNHVVGEPLWMPPLVRGKTIAEVGDQFTGDLLGDDPVKTFQKGMEDAIEALSEPGALDNLAHLSFGDLPNHEYLRQVNFDVWVHGWDLATALGRTHVIPDDEAEALMAWWDGTKELAEASGAFAGAVPAPDDATPMERLIAATGRNPR